MMKLLLFILMAFTLQGYSQGSSGVVNMKSQYLKTVDTVTSTAAKYLHSEAINGAYKLGVVVVTATEINGTTAGTVTLEASVDNVTWYNYYSGMDSSYSFSLADVTTKQGFRFALGPWADKYLRVKVVGISTPNVKINAVYQLRN